ncbi:hypothetical protein DFH05DRAFT_1145726 [Lentinula detonsa]|uniref:Mediator of RNA polymerase II transcription subunit 25 n=1 Tax=Lentinula detonsa TaxID=2804962 RepID=A0A9W8TX40_9AGAR|nr:hypothetical protein DFH05DRAFT_1145726 [Lentinula detonsa]
MAVPEANTRNHLDLGSLAVVVDSSVALAGNWLIILKYLGLFVQKLVQLNHGTGYRIAWVTYGPPDSLPSSLLCKRYFAEIQEVTSLIKVQDELHQLGIGTTHCGGTRGMAMLEGLVAAVELFDILNGTHRRSPSHILHITASFPDNAKHPQANISPSLDDITWEKLPEELSKRNIHLSSIVLNPKNNTKIPEFHSSVALNTASTSWLTVDPPHVAYVASLSLPQKGVKRVADQMNIVEQPPEKRQQLNVLSGSPPRNKLNTNVNVNANSVPITSSNKPPSSGPSNQPQPKLPGAPDQPQASQPPQLFPPLNIAHLPPLNSTQKISWPGNIGNLTPSELLQRWRQLEEMRRRADGALAQAMNSGESAKVDMVKQQIAQLEPMLFKFKTLAMSYLTAVKRAGMAAGQMSNAPAGIPGQTQQSMSTDRGAAPTGAGNSNLASQSQTTQVLPPNPSSHITPSPATKPNDSMMPPSSSVSSDLSTTLAPSASSSTSTKPSPKFAPKNSPKLSAVKPSPKPKPKASPMKNASSVASNASAGSSAASAGSTSEVSTGPVPNSTSGIPLPSNMPPEAALQMQKLVEQGGRGHPRDMAMGSMGQQASPNLMAASVGVPSQQQLPQGQGMQGMMPGQGQPGQPSQVGGVVGTGGAGAMTGGSAGLNVPTPVAGQGRNGGIPVWTGIFFYPGEQGGTRKDIRISVMAMSANHSECRVQTWPSEMTLTRSRDPVVSQPEFQMWAKKMRPVVCTIKPHARNLDARQNAFNEQVFNGIYAMIRGSKTYIVSSWTLPSGAQTNNVLFADVTPHGFIGAFFPATGIPEMPKSIPGLSATSGAMLGGVSMGAGGAPGGPGGAGLGFNIGPPNIITILQTLAVPPELTARILQMPPEGQMQAVKSIVATKQALRNQAQAQGGGGGGSGHGSGQVGPPGMQKPGGSNVNITAAAAAMALRMKQPGGIGMSPGLQGIGVHSGMQGASGLNIAGMQRQVSGQDGNKPLNANMAALLSGMRGNMGGMGGMNAANVGGNMSGGGNNMPVMPGPGNMSLQQQMAQMQQMQQNRAAFGGGGLGGLGGSGAGGGSGGQKLSMDVLQSFIHRNGQEGQGGG